MAGRTEDLELRIGAAVDGNQNVQGLTRTLEDLGVETGAAAQRATTLDTELQRLGANARAVESLRDAAQAAEKAATTFADLLRKSDEMQQRQQALASSILAGRDGLERAAAAAEQLRTAVAAQSIAVREAENRLRDLQVQAKAAGGGNKELADQIARAKSELTAAKATLKTHESALKDEVTIDLPLLPSPTAPGLLLPGQLIEVLDPAGTWRGMVTSVSVAARGVGVTQTLTVERHY